ncbi:histone deacetylase Rpd3S complex subunit [Ophiocordyceps sinensis CO18]|nr:histone deacetylase Rpd3S complex subunit [Ophiocordyceps sinensis CO18]
MQASLTLISLRQKPSEPIDRLTSALISAADDNVLSLMAKSNADNVAVGQLTQDDRQGLRAMLAQIDAMGARIRQVLGEDKPEMAAVSADARTPVSEPPGVNESTKLEPNAPVAEPTPPSTVDHAEGSMELD